MARRVRNLNRPFGRQLRETRMKAGFSQEAFAAECGLHRTYISQLERGLKSPSLKSISVMADALNIRPYQLVKMAEDRR